MRWSQALPVGSGQLSGRHTSGLVEAERCVPKAITVLKGVGAGRGRSAPSPARPDKLSRRRTSDVSPIKWGTCIRTAKVSSVHGGIRLSCFLPPVN